MQVGLKLSSHFSTEFTEEENPHVNWWRNTQKDGKPHDNWWRTGNTQKGYHVEVGMGRESPGSATAKPLVYSACQWCIWGCDLLHLQS
jgi:hypothetical protein